MHERERSQQAFRLVAAVAMVFGLHGSANSGGSHDEEVPSPDKIITPSGKPFKHSLTSLVEITSEASAGQNKESDECRNLEVSVSFEPRDDSADWELVWVREGQSVLEHPDDDIVNWYEYIGELKCSSQEEARSRIVIVGEGWPSDGVGFQRVTTNGVESTLVWVLRYTGTRGEVPHVDTRTHPFYTRPGDTEGTPAAIWVEKK